jgi:hypothetical protein
LITLKNVSIMVGTQPVHERKKRHLEVVCYYIALTLHFELAVADTREVLMISIEPAALSCAGPATRL